MASLLIGLAIVLCIVAILGCILPGLPGTPFALLGALVLHFFVDTTPDFKTSILILMVVLSILSIAVDYILPMLGAKQFGGSKYGSFGAIIGLFIGLLTPIPGGIFVGTLAGAILGELYNQKQFADATKAGIGAIIGMFLGVIVKLTFTGIIVFYMIKNVV